MMKARGVMTGPRWENLRQRLRTVAWMCGIEITMESEKGWLRETVLFELDGDEDAILQFYDAIAATTNRS